MNFRDRIIPYDDLEFKQTTKKNPQQGLCMLSQILRLENLTSNRWKVITFVIS